MANDLQRAASKYFTFLLPYLPTWRVCCLQVAGLGVCLLLVDYLGRRKTLSGSLVMVAAALVPLLATLPGEIVYLVVTRLFIYAAFICLYIYTPEVYPTSIRSYSFGVSNAMARIGGLLAPFIALDLQEQVRKHPGYTRFQAGTVYVPALFQSVVLIVRCLSSLYLTP